MMWTSAAGRVRLLSLILRLAVVSYIAVMDVIFGFAIAGVDLHAGMPLWWTVGESGTIMGVGVVIGALNWPRSEHG